MKTHNNYFMPKDLYSIVQSSIVVEAPLNALSPEEWFQVMKHQYAHGVELAQLEKDPSKKNYLKEMLDVNTNRMFFALLARSYWQENNQGSLLPKEEKALGVKINNLLENIAKNYQWINVSNNVEKVVWDLVAKNVT